MRKVKYSTVQVQQHSVTLVETASEQDNVRVPPSQRGSAAGAWLAEFVLRHPRYRCSLRRCVRGWQRANATTKTYNHPRMRGLTRHRDSSMEAHASASPLLVAMMARHAALCLPHAWRWHAVLQ